MLNLSSMSSYVRKKTSSKKICRVPASHETENQLFHWKSIIVSKGICSKKPSEFTSTTLLIKAYIEWISDKLNLGLFCVIVLLGFMIHWECVPAVFHSVSGNIIFNKFFSCIWRIFKVFLSLHRSNKDTRFC